MCCRVLRLVGDLPVDQLIFCIASYCGSALNEFTESTEIDFRLAAGAVDCAGRESVLSSLVVGRGPTR